MRESMIVACLVAGMAAGAEEWTEARVRGLERRALEAVADLALVPPNLITSPGPEYGAANERWAMNNGAALTPKGRLWASWIGGGDSPDAYTVCAFSDDGGATWGKPALVVDGHAPKRIPFPRSNIIANLWTDPAGKLHLFVSQSMWHNDGRMGVWETVCATPDDAQPAWSPIRRICDGAALNKPVVLRNGTWLLPVELPRPWGPWKGLFGTSETDAGALALASTDGGATWERRGTAMVPDSDWPENHILELKDGTLRMYMRSRPGLRMAESRDEGRTWGAVTKPDGMDQPSARCQVRALASGNWIFVKHLSPPDSYNENKRIGQIAYLSRDEGKTWEGGLVLDDRKSVTYPDVEQGPDGLIYVTHDFERGREAEIILHTFTEEDILAKKFQSPRSRQGIVVMKAMGTKHNQKIHDIGGTATRPAFGDEQLVQVKSSLDGTMQPCWFWAPEKAKTEAVPLLVGLHTWSYGCQQKNIYATYLEEVKKRGWAMAGPDFRGPNKTPSACGGDLAVQDIVDAVNYAKGRVKIDGKRIYIIGGSGGGHMTLLMAGRHPEIWAGCVAFCPITDLARWHADSMLDHPGRGKNYAKMMEGACGGTPSAKPDEYRHRSPLTWIDAAAKAGVPVYIATGIHDGWKGPVPVGHSFRAYNALADAKDRVSEADIAKIDKERQVPASLVYKGQADPFYGPSQKIHFRRTSQNARLTLFEGGHAANYPAGFDFLSRQVKGRAADFTIPTKGSGGEQTLGK